MPMQFTKGSSRAALTSDEVSQYQKTGALALDTRRRRPLYFDGRFLAARDLAREQDYFLRRQADLGRTAGFGVIHGLRVSQSTDPKGAAASDVITITSGHGVTPSGEPVLLTDDLHVFVSDLEEEQKLDLQFGVGTVLSSPKRTRTGLYVLALRPVEFTANPITSYPTSLQGTRQTHDGDIVEATAVALVPYPNPVSTYQADQLRSALAWQIFNGSTTLQSTLNDSLLPLAIVSVKRGLIDWVDPWLVRREVSADYAGLQFGLTDRAAQTAFFQQYDHQLQEVLALRRNSQQNGSFSAAQYFRLLPSAGRFPIESVDATAFTQAFFPQELDVRMSIIPTDEVPALIEESMSLPPIDLTLPSGSYNQLSVFALIPVQRSAFAALAAKLSPMPLQPRLPQILGFRRPIDLLRLYRGDLKMAPVPAGNSADWAAAIGPIGQNSFGFYVRRKSAPQYVDFTNS